MDQQQQGSILCTTLTINKTENNTYNISGTAFIKGTPPTSLRGKYLFAASVADWLCGYLSDYTAISGKWIVKPMYGTAKMDLDEVIAYAVLN